MKYFISFFLFLGINSIIAQDFSSLKIMSEEFPPYNYSLNGEASGFSSEVLNLILKRENSSIKNFKISFLPWAESYKRLNEEKYSMLYVVTKNKFREKLFKWVGPISKAKNGLISFNGKKVEDLKNKFVCSVFEDAGGQMFLEKYPQFKNQLIVVQFPDQCIYMLNANRVDFFAYDLNVFNFLAKKIQLDETQFSMVENFQDAYHFFAFHKSTDDKLIQKWQKQLEEIKKSPEYIQIQKKYLMD